MCVQLGCGKLFQVTGSNMENLSKVILKSAFKEMWYTKSNMVYLNGIWYMVYLNGISKSKKIDTKNSDITMLLFL